MAPLLVNYGQRHVRELESAGDIMRGLKLAPRWADIRSLAPLLKGSSQTGGADVPDGHYAAANMTVTVVPNRNMIFLSLATALAIQEGAGAVAYAAHAGDHFVYHDCRPGFADAMREAIEQGNPGVSLATPFIRLTKADIVGIGSALGVPFEKTWSCYKGSHIHCGRCATCVERQEAFHLAGVVDPTRYIDTAFWREATA